jgi:regulatory LuxR family protein
MWPIDRPPAWVDRSQELATLRAAELWLSVNTVNTHTRHVYAKLGVHSRHEAVDRARVLGLLAPAARTA